MNTPENLYRRFDSEIDDVKPSLRVADLLAILSKLDPTMRIALRDSGGTVRSISEIDIDTLHVAVNDVSFATRGSHIAADGALSRIRYNDLGPAVCID